MNKIILNTRRQEVKETRQYLKSAWTIVMCSCILVFSSSITFTSCSDMLDVESTRQNIEPSIEDKTDSVFYAFGILQAMQQLADQYVFQGEMRGELVKTTQYTDNNLRQLYDYSATTENKYDSAYVYYRVINNCNYYITYCDTAQYNGSTNVVMDKYIATHAIRAWAYLQLARNYGKVPFFTEPLTKISDIDKDYPELDINGILAQLAPDLERYAARYYKVPNFGYTGNTGPSIGSPNWESAAKNFLPRLCFIPLNVVLGDMYLETGDYESAARHFVTYLTRLADQTKTDYTAPMASKNSVGRFGDDDDLPDRSQIGATVNGTTWASIWYSNSVNDIISYIPMATTAQNGQTTQVPLTFGFNYYATKEETGGDPYVDEIQLLPSDAMNLLSDSTDYYYYAATDKLDKFDSIRVAKAGDMRMRSIMHQTLNADTIQQWIDKYKYANIVLYRVSTIWLRLAECFNRLGMPDAAFAILKDGINANILEQAADGSYYMNYITEDTRNKLKTTYPLLSDEYSKKFTIANISGIHTHGAGRAASDCPAANGVGGTTYHTGKSPYQYDRVIGKKLKELADAGVAVGTTKNDTINAVEDLLCDEYALELAFEGCRYYDLLRIADHKNRAGLYGANYGDAWLTRKLGYKGWTPAKKYLPFK